MGKQNLKSKRMAEYLSYCPRCKTEIPVTEEGLNTKCPKCKLNIWIRVENNSGARKEITDLEDPETLNQGQRKKIAKDNYIGEGEVDRVIKMVKIQRKDALIEKERKAKQMKEDKIKRDQEKWNKIKR
jgi:predicted RNA-binding Zn-ribbon protein involved in translation (DUF1610 family)